VSSSPTEVSETLTDVTMPQMGVSVVEGTIVAWRAGVGDRIEAEQTICEISTDKIDTELPAPVSGTVAEILVEVDQTVEVGVVLARIAGASGGGAAVPDGAGAPAAPKAAPAPSAPSAPSAPGSNGGRSRRYSPVVQRIAAEHGIDLDTVTGTGRDGRVRKQDVIALVSGNGHGAEPPLHIESPYRPDPDPAPGGGTGQLSRMRRQIGQHMKRSLETAATCTTWIEADMSAIERARAELGLTALPLVARCAIEALREYPLLNAWLEEDRHTVHSDVNLGIAVSLGDDGLIVPVIRAAQDLSAEGLSKRIKELARGARSRQITPDDLHGATFTITNPGQFGSIMATPVINQPQVAILDLEAVTKRPVVVTDDDGNDSIAIRPMTILGLSWDHRALDGALAAQFLAETKRRIEGWR
jgi:pyruvate/2-oxoglutarate dehydrogenase complex dihydrolipoamide acyltransferase (E2) component